MERRHTEGAGPSDRRPVDRATRPESGRNASRPLAAGQQRAAKAKQYQMGEPMRVEQHS
jgi:hypothetical protein